MRVYYGPQAEAGSCVAESDQPPRHGDRPLGEIFPLLADAVRSERTWLRDFADDEITISTDLYEVILAYSALSPPFGLTARDPVFQRVRATGSPARPRPGCFLWKALRRAQGRQTEEGRRQKNRRRSVLRVRFERHEVAGPVERVVLCKAPRRVSSRQMEIGQLKAGRFSFCLPLRPSAFPATGGHTYNPGVVQVSRPVPPRILPRAEDSDWREYCVADTDSESLAAGFDLLAPAARRAQLGRRGDPVVDRQRVAELIDRSRSRPTSWPATAPRAAT